MASAEHEGHRRADCYSGKGRNTAPVTDISTSGTPAGFPVATGIVAAVDRDQATVMTAFRDVGTLNRNMSSSRQELIDFA